MNHKSIVQKQIGVGLLILIIFYGIICTFLPNQLAATKNQALAFSLLFMQVPLYFGIGKVLMARFLSNELINGYQSSNDGIEFEKAYLENTKEQTIAAVVTNISLYLVVPEKYSYLIYVQALTFTLGRAIFYVGYKASPMKRFVGFIVTWYSTLLSFLIATFFLFAYKI